MQTTPNHLKLNLHKTELLFIPGKDCPFMDLSVTIEDITVSPSSTSGNQDVIICKKLSCTPNITTVAQSCRFALYNICRIRSFLTKDATQLLVQVPVISSLVYCNSLLADLPASATKCCSISRTLQCPFFFQSTQILPCGSLPWCFSCFSCTISCSANASNTALKA